jgi:hypothetical protein
MDIHPKLAKHVWPHYSKIAAGQRAAIRARLKYTYGGTLMDLAVVAIEAEVAGRIHEGLSKDDSRADQLAWAQEAVQFWLQQLDAALSHLPRDTGRG